MPIFSIKKNSNIFFNERDYEVEYLQIRLKDEPQ